MDLYVYSRALIERVTPHEVPHIIVSITSGASDVARLPRTDMCLGILRLVFPDADAPSALYPPHALFNVSHARQIWAFVLQHRENVERVLVHCDAGLSRSPAVAAAIAPALGVDPSDFTQGRYQPNRLVLRVLSEAASEFAALGRPTSPLV